jgi:hypothetical protein
MNRYGAQAMAHWQEFDPQRYAEIDSPEEFFTRLGEEVMNEIDLRSRGLAGSDNDHPGETYLQKVGRLNMANFTAESDVLRELVLIPHPDDEEEGEAPVDGTMGEHYAMLRQLRREEQDQEELQTTQAYVDECNRREALGLPLPDDYI